MKRYIPSQDTLDTLRESAAAVAILVVLLLALILWVRSMGLLQILDFTTYDTFIQLNEQRLQGAEPIVLVRVTEEDINTLGEWPLTDDTLAKVIDRITAGGARVIGIDIYRDKPVPPGSEALNERLVSNDRIIVVNKIGSKTAPGVGPPVVLSGSERVGFSDIVLDSDGVVRRGLLFADDGDRTAFGFALRMALRYLEDESVYPRPGIPEPSWLRLGTVTLPPIEEDDGPYVNADTGGYQVLMKFRGGFSPFVSVSLSQLFDGAVPGDLFKDKVVILGVDAESVRDSFFIPPRQEQDAWSNVPGIVVHAHLVSQLLHAGLADENPLLSFRQPLVFLWIIAAGVLGGAAGIWLRSIMKLVTVSLAGVAIIFLIAFVLYSHGWWLSPVSAGLAWVGCAGLVTAYLSGYEHVQRELLMRLFAKHVSNDVADEIWRQRKDFTQSGRPASRKLMATVLFTDIEHFTTVSEKLSPKSLMDWLNTYMEAMANRIIEHGGVIDDYYGDAIKANFGVPMPRTAESEIHIDARNALSCALAMQTALVDFNDQCVANGLPRLRMRIGICTGPVIAGCLGSSKRMKYTTVGDTVNTAARLESYDKADFRSGDAMSACRILVAASTLKYVGSEYCLLHVGELSLRGKDEKVDVFQLTGTADTDTASGLKEVS